MIQFTSALLICGAFFLASCTPRNTSGENSSTKSSESCVAGFVETSPGKGTLDIYFPTDFAPDVQSIPDVSVTVAEEVSNQIGVC